MSFIVARRDRGLPEALLDRAKELLIDHAAVSVGALDLPWSRTIRNRANVDGGPPESTVYGGGRVAARNAALANATIAHAIELDDTHIPSLSHMSAVVFPAALAMAESCGAGGRQFLTAYILGCEAMGRIGRAAGQALLSRGFHPTSTNGVFGAAAAAATILKLDERRTESAFGLALSMASGAMQFSIDASGTTVKRLHAGMPSERGILAALLARDDFAGPARSIEGERGFLQLFASETDASSVTDGLGSDFMIENMSIKLNACCLHFASLVDAINACAAGAPIAGDQIERIQISGPRALLDGHMEYRPKSVMAAQYSLPYVTAATLLLDPRKPASFDDQTMLRPDLLALADRVTATQDLGLERLFPAKFPARASIVFKDGRKVESVIEDARGTAARPLARYDIEAKFRVLTGDTMSTGAQGRLLQAIDDIEASGGVSRFADLMASAGTDAHQR